jgi:hypothetical protein
MEEDGGAARLLEVDRLMSPSSENK